MKLDLTPVGSNYVAPVFGEDDRTPVDPRLKSRMRRPMIVGGLVIGVLLAAGITYMVGQVNLGGQQLSAIMSIQSIILAVGVSFGIGLFFGMYPAWRAAKLNPIEALRYE